MLHEVRSFGLSAEQERSFRQYSLPSDIRQARIGILLIFVPIMVYVFNDYQFFGDSAGFYWLAILRTGLGIYSVGLLYILVRSADHLSYDKSITAWLTVSMVVNLIINLTRPQNFAVHVIVVAAFVFIILLIIPTRFPVQIGLASFLALGETLILMFATQISVMVLFPILVSLLFVCLIASTSSWHLHVQRRRAFQEITERRRAEHALVQERDRLTSLVGSISDEVWFADLEGKLTLTNPAADRVATVMEVFRIDGSLRPEYEAPYQKALKGEVVKGQEDMVRSPVNGELRYRQVNASPVRDANGQIIGSVSVVRDITDSKRAERARETTIEFLHLINESHTTEDLVNAATLFFKKESGCEDVNVLLGEDEKGPYHAVRSSPVPAMNDSSLRLDDADGAPGTGDWRPSRRGLRRGEPGPGKVRSNGTVLLRPRDLLDEQRHDSGDQDGGRHPFIHWRPNGTGWLRIGGAHPPAGRQPDPWPSRTEGPQDWHVLGRTRWGNGRTWPAIWRSPWRSTWWRTISKESRREFESLFSASNEGMALQSLVYDGDGMAVDFRIMKVNAVFESITGIAKDKAVGMLASELYGGGEAPFLDIYQKVAETGEPCSFDAFFPPMDKHFRISAFSPVEGQFATVFVDISALKEMEEALNERADELVRSNQELQQFAYLASHDLQEPLRMVTSYLSLLERKHSATLDSEAREYMDYAISGGKRMKALIDDLLEYSRVETKVRLINKVDMNRIAHETLMIYDLMITESRAKIVLDDLPVVTGDALQLGQLMQNLLANALKFTRPDVPPLVHISCSEDRNRWIFSIEDNGIGMNMEHTARIFQMFQRLHTHGRYEGTGVGLAIVKKIVERHRGKVWVESEEGVGSTFFFTLPKDAGS